MHNSFEQNARRKNLIVDDDVDNHVWYFKRKRNIWIVCSKLIASAL